MVLVNEKLKGGAGYSASTVQDLGFEPTDGGSRPSDHLTEGRVCNAHVVRQLKEQSQMHRRT